MVVNLRWVRLSHFDLLRLYIRGHSVLRTVLQDMLYSTYTSTVDESTTRKRNNERIKHYLMCTGQREKHAYLSSRRFKSLYQVDRVDEIV